MDDMNSLAKHLITESLHGDKAPALADATDRCEQTFNSTLLNGITVSCVPEPAADASNAAEYKDAVVFGLNSNLRYGNIDVIKTVGAAGAFKIDLGSHGYKPDGVEPEVIAKHLREQGIEARRAGNQVTFTLTNPTEIILMQEFSNAQRDRRALLTKR